MACQQYPPTSYSELTIKVLDVKIDTSTLCLILEPLLLVHLLQLVITLNPLLGTADVDLLAVDLLLVEGVYSIICSVVVNKVDEAEARLISLIQSTKSRLTLCQTRHRSCPVPRRRYPRMA